MRPIGVFDSGVGGLTVVAALRRRLPRESILYLGDTARLPYGTKSPATVRRYTEANIRFLLARGVKAVVVACNTASTSLPLDSLEASVPVWGVVEPGAQAVSTTSAGRVGVLATESTIGSGAYERAISARRRDLAVITRACPLFVPLVEEGWVDDPVTEAVAHRYLDPLLEARVDTLLLGCTHYPLLRPLLRRVVGDEVEIVDSAEATAETVAAGLPDPVTGPGPRPEHHFCVTDSGDRFRRLAGRFLGLAPEEDGVSLEWVDVDDPLPSPLERSHP